MPGIETTGRYALAGNGGSSLLHAPRAPRHYLVIHPSPGVLNWEREWEIEHDPYSWSAREAGVVSPYETESGLRVVRRVPEIIATVISV